MKRLSQPFWKYLNTGLLLVLVIILAYALFWPIDVLENSTWKVTVAGGSTHYLGETISVTSKYEKKMQVTGEAKRYLDCTNESDGFVRYPMNKADANRVLGSQATGLFLVIPDAIPTPTKCKVVIDIRYKINPLRTHAEYNESALFDLVAK